MSADERTRALWSIINMCDAAACLIGHVDVLLKIENHPAVTGLSGILDAIKAQANAIASSEVAA